VPTPENPQAETAEPQPGATILGLGRIRLGAVIALAAAAVFVGWLLLKGDDGKPAPKKTIEFVSLPDLRALPASVGHPVYWAGAKRGYKYELTRLPDGSIYIRYLAADAPLNDSRPDFLSVGTYPYPNAYVTARKLAKASKSFNRGIAGAGIAYSLPGKDRSVFFAYPRLDFMHEVYDPSPRRAQRLVLSGQVRPID
jgi:hypothetical protein